MTSGHKHLYSCVTFIVFMVIINFYKNKINQAREREAFVRAKAKGSVGGHVGRHAFHQITKKQHLPGTGGMDREDESDKWFDFGVEDFQPSSVETESILDRMKEYPEVCRDMEVFYFSKEKSFETLDTGKGHDRKIVSSHRTNHDQGSNSSMYVFLSVLIILLIAAAVDIAKHVRDIPRQDNIRRLSLQNYQTLIREKQKQFRMMKQHYSQPSMSFGGSFDEPTHPTTCEARSKDEPDFRRVFGGAAKSVNPLLRRQSVPVFMPRPLALHLPVGKQLLRRPSADSFVSSGEGRELDHGLCCNKGLTANGSPTEMRRRVRMIHRH